MVGDADGFVEKSRKNYSQSFKLLGAFDSRQKFLPNDSDDFRAPFLDRFLSLGYCGFFGCARILMLPADREGSCGRINKNVHRRWTALAPVVVTFIVFDLPEQIENVLLIPVCDMMRNAKCASVCSSGLPLIRGHLTQFDDRVPVTRCSALL